MDHPDNISTPQRMSMPSSEQQMIDEFWREKQEEIEAIDDFSKRAIPMTCLKKIICAEKGKMMMTFDTPSFVTKACEIFVQELSLRSWICANSHHRDIILDSDIAEAIASMESYVFLNDVLCKHQAEHNSAHHPKSIKKSSHNRLTDQPQTSGHPRYNKYPMPQFISQSARYPLFALPPPLPPTNDYHVPLPLRFLPRGACPLMATTITQTPVLGGTIHHLPNIPNEGYMSRTPSMDTYYVESASKNNVVSQDGDVTFHYPFVPPVAWKSLSIPPVANSNGPISTGIIELHHTKQLVAHMGNTTHASHLNVTHGRLDTEVISTTNLNGKNNEHINWDETDMADDSLLMEFWEDVMMEEDRSTLPDTTSSTVGIVPVPCDKPDPEGFDPESFLVDDIIFDESTNKEA
ncbi:uncharacterized protein LOC8082814 [Sorghum bicolor]|uniref:Histone H2A/H2B/H3 domain-containing protein n=1 Tax=Sorghum bicolor TaxID=4558 RepID=C5YTK1_SORBI|nr:uncharacterized protein LOC8082814 [Sorghum bicolor]XP_021301644.1 uncharacterized protein LOC8082814 [Sorghum bicolor]XP_021301645.1 uncharacterized protein LOC8082814 [Sorghum bicolor]EES15819.1 hypothetical protein SORBI_3008G071900 [Sorghum bicolor]|eukprot:XP_002441981.1 uncharacterized protein LOC8082814 [Sorghum bicolor]